MTETIIWQPDEERIKNSHMWAFIQAVEKRYDLSITNYAALHKWSLNQTEYFWTEVWRYCGIVGQPGCSKPLTKTDAFPGWKWFKDSRLNFAENLLRHAQTDIKHKNALVFCNEKGHKRTLSFVQLQSLVAALAKGLRNVGVHAGDRVAGLLPNIPEAVAAMLATTSIGAVWSSCSPDFGIDSILDRFGQIQPKVLFASDGYFYNGKTFDCIPQLAQLQEKLPSLQQVVLINYTRTPKKLTATSINFDAFTSCIDNSVPEFTALPFDHPLYIMYSSGTTGAPKCIVHGAGGTLIQHLKELVLHTNLGKQDNIFYYTTCGWMMWNWLVSGLATGATVCLYDGAANFPDVKVLFDLAEREKISVFGVSAKYLSALDKSNLAPIQQHDLTALKCILSTGSPLAPESFDYVYQKIKHNVQLASISGGTDILSCFALGNPILPVRRGELQCAGLGMNVMVYNEAGQAVADQKGELVCRPPFPSMPLYFWNDPHHEKYRKTYFDKYPDLWTQGDFALKTHHGGFIIFGRSDATLNPGGVRMGTAEIYRQVEKLPEVLESIAVGQNWQGDVRIILFVKLRLDLVLSETLRKKIARNIRDNASPRHVPKKIIQVADIPRTRSGKIVELAVQNVIHKRPVTHLGVLANPEALTYFKDIPELEKD